MLQPFSKAYRPIWLTLVVGILVISANPRTVQPEREQPFGPITLGAADSLLAHMSVEERIALCFTVVQKEEDWSIMPGGVCVGGEVAPYIAPSHLSGFQVADWHDLDSFILPSAAIGSLDSLPQIEAYGFELGHFLNQRGYSVLTGISADLLQDHRSPSAVDAIASEPDAALEVLEAFTGGLQAAGIHPIVGSYPGLSSAKRGLEQTAPVVFSKREGFQRRELIAFKGLVNRGIPGVMMANAFDPALDSSHDVMASHSSILHTMLREQLGFQGMIWSDVRSIPVNQGNDNNAAVKALVAGADMVIIDHALDQHIDLVKQQIDWELLSLEELDEKCRRILQAQLWTERQRQYSQSDQRTRRRLNLATRVGMSQAMLCVQNDDATLPIKALDTTRLAVVKIGTINPALNQLIDRYAPAELYQFSAAQLDENITSFLAGIEDNTMLLIIAEEDRPLRRRSFGMTESMNRVLNALTKAKRNILVWNGPDLALAERMGPSKTEAILIGHTANRWSDDVAVQAVFGGRAVEGKLRRKFKRNQEGLQAFRTAQIRLAYGSPEEVGMRTEDLAKIETIALKGIKEMAYPGCQVWFAKDSMVVYDRSFGYHTYEKEEPVRNTDLYDLASITKIAGTIGALMHLTEEGKFSLNHRLCDYLDDWVDTTEYKQLGMREILAHQAGLTPWIPFYTQTLSKGVPRYDVYSIAQSESYPKQVARELYIREGYEDRMFREVLNTKLQEEKKYKYSDVGYYFMQRIIERVSSSSLDRYMDSIYYQPLGLTTMGYRPFERFPKERITPTEYDRNFRGQLIQGYVHDPGAAMLGGVGGHAGLFSNANNLGVLMQLYLNGGSYGGKKYFSPEVIEDFTRCQFCENDNRRGAGFDKPLTDGSAGPSCGCTDLEAFGHQGFTGTVTWADPGEDVVYVFLSNRVYPNANNRKLLELDIRTDIQQVFYDAIEKGKELAREDNS